MNATPHHVTRAPLLPLLLRLSMPNVLAGFTSVLMILVDGVVLGEVGPAAVAASAVTLPLLMLLTGLAASSFTGTVAALAGQALGANQPEQADAVASYAIGLSLALGLLMAALFAAAGEAALLASMSIDGVARAAYAYGWVLVAAAPVILFSHAVQGLMRAQGDVKTPAQISLLTAVLHAALALAFVADVGGLRRLGITAPAANLALAFGLPCLWQLAYLRRSRYRLGVPTRKHLPLLRALVAKGCVAAAVPVLSNGTALLGAYAVSQFGAAALSAYSVGIRLEYLVVPVAFGVGLSLLTVVGINRGAMLIERARRAVWLGATMSAVLVFTLTIGLVLWPDSSLRLLGLTGDTLDIGRRFLRIVGPLYFLYGFGLTLFFAAQALGRPLWGVAGSAMRLLIVGLGAALALSTAGAAPVTSVFALMALAMLAYAAVMTLGLRRELARAALAR